MPLKERIRRWLRDKVLTREERRNLNWRDDPDVLFVLDRRMVASDISVVCVPLTELSAFVQDTGDFAIRLVPKDILAIGCKRRDGKVVVEFQLPVRH